MNTPAQIKVSEIKFDEEQSKLIGASSIKIQYSIPAIYDDMENIDNNKIAERFPKFGFGDLLDEILDDFGGVQDIFSCEWDETRMEGEVVCLMNDWRVFRYFLKQNDLSILDREARIKLINKDCIVFEDIDDWSAWKELADVRIEHEKKEIKKKEEIDKSSVYGEKYSDALKDFFNGGLDAIQKIMSQNNNV